MLSEDGGALMGINGLLQIFGGSSSVKSDQLRVYDDGAVATSWVTWKIMKLLLQYARRHKVQ